MNIKEFLKAIDPDAGWRLSSHGCIRDRKGDCPLYHVAALAGYTEKHERFIADAADTISLDRELVTPIMTAADNNLDRYFHGTKIRDRFNAVREQLLEATGLKETV